MSAILAFLVGKKISLRARIIMQESLNQFSIGGLVRLAKYILISTVVIEGVGATILFFYWGKGFIPLSRRYIWQSFILSQHFVMLDFPSSLII
jgi:Trk-type K+ transport system membrane component